MVICTLISPYAQERAKARLLWDSDAFIEVFVNTPLEVCEARDPKGLYKKARSGEITQFTGLDAPYERPSDPDLVVDTTELSIDQSVECVKSCLKSRKLLG
jgi:adenylylsulfate kinase-like enzyme